MENEDKKRDEERRKKEREVTEASEQSFPASDPPASSYPGDGASK